MYMINNLEISGQNSKILTIRFLNISLNDLKRIKGTIIKAHGRILKVPLNESHNAAGISSQ